MYTKQPLSGSLTAHYNIILMSSEGPDYIPSCLVFGYMDSMFACFEQNQCSSIASTQRSGITASLFHRNYTLHQLDIISTWMKSAPCLDCGGMDFLLVFHGGDISDKSELFYICILSVFKVLSWCIQINIFPTRRNCAFISDVDWLLLSWYLLFMFTLQCSLWTEM